MFPQVAPHKLHLKQCDSRVRMGIRAISAGRGARRSPPTQHTLRALEMVKVEFPPQLLGFTVNVGPHTQQ